MHSACFHSGQRCPPRHALGRSKRELRTPPSPTSASPELHWTESLGTVGWRNHAKCSFSHIPGAGGLTVPGGHVELALAPEMMTPLLSSADCSAASAVNETERR